MNARERERRDQLLWSRSLLDRIFDNEIGTRPRKFPTSLYARNIHDLKSIDLALMPRENAEYFVSLKELGRALKCRRV